MFSAINTIQLTQYLRWDDISIPCPPDIVNATTSQRSTTCKFAKSSPAGAERWGGEERCLEWTECTVSVQPAILQGDLTKELITNCVTALHVDYCSGNHVYNSLCNCVVIHTEQIIEPHLGLYWSNNNLLSSLSALCSREIFISMRQCAELVLLEWISFYSL